MIDLTYYHGCSFANVKAVKLSTYCGCFYCCEIYLASEVVDFIKERVAVDDTALCPKCGIDSVLPGCDVILSKSFLKMMKERWFDIRSDQVSLQSL